MKAKWIKRSGFVVWLVGLALSSGGWSTPVAAKGQDGSVAAQDKDKKDEKKEEKKDEKKGLSLKPTRKIEFTTDEGTWLSLDASPDGKIIVFELLGDIYTQPIEGGTAKLIDGGMAFDSQPKFSPDGKWIAFISDREGSENIWVMHPDGSGIRVLVPENAGFLFGPAWQSLPAKA